MKNNKKKNVFDNKLYVLIFVLDTGTFLYEWNKKFVPV